MNEQNNFNNFNNLNNDEINHEPVTLNKFIPSEPETLKTEVPSAPINISNNEISVVSSAPINDSNLFDSQESLSNSFNNNSNLNNNIQPEILDSNPVTFNNSNDNNSNKKKYLKIIIIVAIFVVVILGIIIAIKSFKHDNNNLDLISNTFFVENEKGLSAIFSVEGKQLTDYEYQIENSIYNETDFINHAVNVKNSKGEVGVINDKGKVVIDFGKFETITRVGGLYQATDKDLNQFLYDSSGKKIKSLDLLSIIKHGDLYVIISNDDKYELINYEGKVILTIKKLDDNKPEADIEGEILSVYYNGKNYIVNVVSGKIISEFDANESYCIHDTKANDTDSFILSKCGNLYSGYDDVSSYKIIKNGKLVKEQNEYECGKIFYVSKNLHEDDDYIFCQGNKYKFMDDEGKVLVENDYEIAFIDKNNYALFTEDSYESSIVKIYKDGQLVKELENTSGYGFSSNYLYPLNNNYIFYSYEDFDDSMDYIGGVRFYNKNGDAISKKYYKAVDDYDSNGFAYIWLDDGHALMNEKEEIVTDFFEKGIESYKNYYIAKNSDNITIFDSNLKVILNNCQKISESKTIKGLLYLLEKDEKYYVFNTETQKIVYETKNEISLRDKYMQYTEGNEKIYISYEDNKEFLRTSYY